MSCESGPGRRAASFGPNERGKRTRITATGFANKEGDVRKRLRAFRAAVWRYYKSSGRHDLPWRKTHDPYKILVSEIMLQQTGVARVIEKYGSFLEKFPTAPSLAQAPLSAVLKEWSGLGYNRRGKYLHDAAKVVAERYGGKIPRDFAALRQLPGIGEYTASAVRVFAFNEPAVLIETNVRTAFIHHFFAQEISRPRLDKIADSALAPIVRKAAQRQDPRAWHWALMDYGAHLKKSGVRNNHRSAHYAKQSKFEGSLRQVRGAILRELHRSPSSCKTLPFERIRIGRALASLSRDGLIRKERGRWRIA